MYAQSHNVWIHACMHHRRCLMELASVVLHVLATVWRQLVCGRIWDANFLWADVLARVYRLHAVESPRINCVLPAVPSTRYRMLFFQQWGNTKCPHRRRSYLTSSLQKTRHNIDLTITEQLGINSQQQMSHANYQTTDTRDQFTATNESWGPAHPASEKDITHT